MTTRKDRLLTDNITARYKYNDFTESEETILTPREVFEVITEINARLNSAEKSIKFLREVFNARR